ncbi:MAG: cbb3-type cytochrome oxidase assembly protein [Opitutales bacterium]
MDIELKWYLSMAALGFVGLIIVIGFAWAFRWAVRNGQFKNLDEGSRVIFDEEEPEGKQLDHFPGKH